MNFPLFFISVLHFIFLVGCSTSFIQRSDIAQDQLSLKQSKDYEHIKQLYTNGNINQAIILLKAFIEEHPTDDARFLLGSLYYQQKKYKNAYTVFSFVTSGSRHINEAKIRAAYCLSHLDIDNKKKSYQLVTQILQTLRLSSQQKIRVYQLKISLLRYIEVGTVEQIETHIHLSKLVKDLRLKEDHRLKALSLVQSQLNEDELKQVAKDIKVLRGPAFFQLGSLFFDQGDFRNAKSYLKKAVYWNLDEDYEGRAKKMLAQIDLRHKVNPNTIGAILPLSGKDAVFGYKALRGLQLALDIYQDAQQEDFQLAVIDSQSNPLIAKNAVERLIVEDQVIAIVGSLMSKTASAVASQAQKFLVPSITLSQKNDITEIGNYVFQNALTSQMQIEFLVETAMKRGLKHFAILYPNDRYGIEYAQLFWNSVLERRGKIVAAQTYTKEETDFREQIQRMIGTFYKKDRRVELKEKLEAWRAKNPNSRRSPPNNLLEPLIFFDALFIPDEVKIVGQVAPMLVYNDVENMTLLGTNLWNTPLLSQRAGQFLETPIFVDSFSMLDREFIHSPFYRNYVRVFGQKPHILEMQAFEAGLILKEVIERGADTRLKVQKMMVDIQLNGVLGELKMTEKRQVKRPMVSLTYNKKNGQISKLSESP